jgi:hypothetical protein
MNSRESSSNYAVSLPSQLINCGYRNVTRRRITQVAAGMGLTSSFCRVLLLAAAWARFAPDKVPADKMRALYGRTGGARSVNQTSTLIESK